MECEVMFEWAVLVRPTKERVYYQLMRSKLSSFSDGSICCEKESLLQPDRVRDRIFKRSAYSLRKQEIATGKLHEDGFK